MKLSLMTITFILFVKPAVDSTAQVINTNVILSRQLVKSLWQCSAILLPITNGIMLKFIGRFCQHNIDIIYNC